MYKLFVKYELHKYKLSYLVPTSNPNIITLVALSFQFERGFIICNTLHSNKTMFTQLKPKNFK